MLITDSPIIQYTIYSTLSGVSDPPDPDVSLSNRLDTFDQWETTWREIDLRKPNANIDEPVLAENDPDIEYSFGRYFVLSREGYGISGPGYAFLDLYAKSSSSHINAARWKTIKVKAYNLMLAFAPELVASDTPRCGDPMRARGLKIDKDDSRITRICLGSEGCVVLATKLILQYSAEGFCRTGKLWFRGF